MVMLQDKAERGPRSFCPLSQCRDSPGPLTRDFWLGLPSQLAGLRQDEQGSAVPTASG